MGDFMKGRVISGLIFFALFLNGQSAMAGEPDGCHNFLSKMQYERALPECKKAAEQGDALAQYYLGVMYDKGKGVTRDAKEAARWYRKAADQGHASAQRYLEAMKGQ
jgi:TPR repeat protein